MNDRIVRFLGDPREFFVSGEVIDQYTARPQALGGASWVVARVGIPERKIKVNLAVAYSIEHVNQTEGSEQWHGSSSPS